MTEEPYITYAQNREDLLLNAFFEDSEKGFYVDVGANHPVHESVTKFFYDKGWHGMNLEPTPRLHELLKLTRPRDINVQVGVSDKSGSLTFREYPHGDGLSTFATEMQKDYERNDGFFSYFTSDYLEYEVPVKTLAELFKEYKVKEIDFLKVDIEGYEYEALAGNDWKIYRPKVLCVEANHIVKDWHKLISDAGYEVAFFDGLNEYFVAKEERNRAKNFSYPDRVLFGPQYIRWSDYKAEWKLKRDTRLLQYRLDKATYDAEVAQGSRLQTYSAKQQIKHNIRRADAAIEHRLERRPKASNQQLPEIRSVATFQEALVSQLQNSHDVSHNKSTSLRTYRLLKKGAKRVVRRVRK